MAHCVTPASAAATATSARSGKSSNYCSIRVRAGQCHHHGEQWVRRRTLTVGLGLSLSLCLSQQSACAAARRPPPPPPEEKKDPNVSGVQAKVLASKKRKEALKETVAKLREKGKPIRDKEPEPPDQ